MNLRSKLTELIFQIDTVIRLPYQTDVGLCICLVPSTYVVAFSNVAHVVCCPRVKPHDSNLHKIAVLEPDKCLPEQLPKLVEIQKAGSDMDGRIVFLSNSRFSIYHLQIMH